MLNYFNMTTERFVKKIILQGKIIMNYFEDDFTFLELNLKHQFIQEKFNSNDIELFYKQVTEDNVLSHNEVINYRTFIDASKQQLEIAISSGDSKLFEKLLDTIYRETRILIDGINFQSSL